MKKRNQSISDNSELRERANGRLKKSKKELKLPETKEDLLKLVEELKIHQIELEMINQELKESRDELEISSHQYSELYDFAPTGYLTINFEGRIILANLTISKMLEFEQNRLLNYNFIEFVVSEDRDKFSNFLKKICRDKIKSSCELSLLKANKEAFFVKIDALINHEEKNCLLSVVDITKLKNAEIELENRLTELERFNSIMVGRENKMVELKIEINDLLKKSGKPSKYDVDFNN